MANKTRIEWTDYSWNPVTGCLHGCDYCYARAVTKRFPKVYPQGFEPTLHPQRLNDFEGGKAKGKRVFVCSMADLFGEWVPREWIEAVIDVARRHPDITFQFLTKNPKRYGEFIFPKNCWLGTTVDSWKSWNGKVLADTPNDNLKYISFEPLLDGEMAWAIVQHHSDKIGWVIIGALSGPNAMKGYSKVLEWARQIIEECRRDGIPVFLKDNLGYPEDIKEFP